MRYIRILSELSNQMKYSTSKRVLAEVAIVKLSKPQMENNLESVLNRIENLEKNIETNGFVRAPVINQEPVSVGITKMEESQPKKFEIAVPEEIQEAVNNWGRIQSRVTRPASMYLKNVRLTVAGEGTLLIVTQDKNGYLMINRESTIQEIQTLIAQEIGKEVRVEVKLLEEEKRFEDTFTEITKNINMEIIEEEF